MKRIDGINVIPFIDIMLVLLAIVLTTATFIVEERLEIQLPESSAQDNPADAQGIELSIDAVGRIFLDGAPATLDDLKKHLATLPPETRVVLRVDRAARFARFVKVVDLLKARGLDKLTILTRQTAA
jgi:biopolymer transport protein ExbD